MLDVVLGEKRSITAVDGVVAVLLDLKLTGTLYVGYPILSTADATIFVDALLTTKETGIVVLDLEPFTSAEALRLRQSDLRAAIQQRLLSSRLLRSPSGVLAIDVTVVSVLPGIAPVSMPDLSVATIEGLDEAFQECQGLTSEQLREINAIIQRVTTLKPPRKRASVASESSRGMVMKRIEREIANLDAWQNAAAVEMPDGPQRIRGLAGSGKTIVLALKAAYLHARHPDWKIAITFHTRSLYQQFTDLIRRFVFEQVREEPTWENLSIMHSWGSSSSPGVYATISSANGLDAQNLQSARAKYPQETVFEGVCSELLTALAKTQAQEIWDVVLIDEAQDLPQPFFELVYLSTKEPKRIVWAYDELQNLGDYRMPPGEELFGRNAAGELRVGPLANTVGMPRRDIVLRVCYRNTPWAISVAHAIALGIYRTEGLVQYFDAAGIWEEAGYEIVSGSLEPGSKVSVRRRLDSYPAYFNELVKPQDAVSFHIFDSDSEEFEWIAEQIKTNVTNDELELSDILVVIPDFRTIRSSAANLMLALNKRGIPSHLAGVTSSVDRIFDEESVAISGVFRAKGNEAAMVYVLNAQYAAPGFEIIKRRNSLFTAMTRARGWLRVCGVGDGMGRMEAEHLAVVENNYTLTFSVPKEEERKKMRTIYRERTKDEKATLTRAQAGIAELVKMLRAGDISIAALPEELKTLLSEVTELGGDDS